MYNKNQKEKIFEFIENKRELFINAADEIWETPELRFATNKSVKHFLDILNNEGFKVEQGVANMKNAFIATFGNGKPVVGILVEYDALSNTSQEEDCFVQKAKIDGGNGHACGHNLLGTGALAAAVGLKEYMKSEQIKGTIKVFGCPAEESGYGKAFMARDDVFDGLDCALAWHPNENSSIWGGESLAVYQLYYHFKGISSHASAMPERGRSALDAAELMNVGVQFLREHIIDEARIHYAFVDSGGGSANVVQPTASLYYFIRAPRIEEAKPIMERVNKIAEGAAMMTETELKIDFDSACLNYIPNITLSEAMQKNLEEFGILDLTEEELSYAKKYVDTLSDEQKDFLIQRAKEEFNDENLGKQGILLKPLPFKKERGISGSTDVGDVSWITPVAQTFIGCEPQGTAFHSWQWVANGKSSIAHKGLIAAGKVIAATAYDILTNPDLLEKAQKEFEDVVGKNSYKSGIPKEVKPK